MKSTQRSLFKSYFWNTLYMEECYKPWSSNMILDSLFKLLLLLLPKKEYSVNWLSPCGVKCELGRGKPDKSEAGSSGVSSRWRQPPASNMPNHGSHFLLHGRLLWNFSSGANVTAGRSDREGIQAGSLLVSHTHSIWVALLEYGFWLFYLPLILTSYV